MDNQKEIEKLIDNLMTLDRLETPSVDFTKKVVDIAIKTKSERIEYKPLMPKWVLYLTVVTVISFLVYGINLYVTSGTSTPYFKDLNKLGPWSSNFFAQFNFSKTLTYAVLISGLMICFHTLVLKKHFKNRLV